MINKLKSSLGAKITAMLLAVSVVLLAAVWIIARENTEKEITAYYKRLAKVISDLSREVVADYMDDPEANMEKMEMLAREVNSLCKDELIDMAFIAKEDETNTKVGDILMIVLDDSIEIKGADQYQGFYSFDLEELEIMEGRKNETTITYNARIGEVISFNYGYDIENGHTGETTRIIVGCNVTLDIFNSSIGSAMRNLFFAMLLIIILVIILIRIMVYKTAVIPFRALSDHMNNFVQHNEMHFETLQVVGQDERASTAAAFNRMGEEIRSYIERVNRLEGERQRSLAEAKVASEIQRGLLPAGVYEKAPFTVKGCMHPAQNVGGDLYYYHRLDENRIAFAIGDVSGKGISAALFMSSTMGAIRYNLQNCSSPAEALKAVNNDMIANNPGRLFVTLFIGIADAKAHKLTYSNAGHNPPYKVGEKLEPLTGGKGILAGIFADEAYEDAVVSFDGNDRIFLYTDGVTEAVNAQKDFFGEERLERTLSKNDRDLLGSVLAQLHSFVQEAEQYDDITMMTIGFTAEERSQTEE